MFIGPKLSSVFASRWKALLWSASILVTAYCTVPSPDADGGKAATADPTVSAVAGIMGVHASTDAATHTSPWAPTPSPTPDQ